MKASLRIIFLSSVILFSLALTNSIQIESFVSAKEGKLLYTKGIRSSGVPINAQLSGTTFNAKILPCVNCHGGDGKGIPEGGVVPSPVDWVALTKSYGVTYKNGRKRTAGYDEESLLTLLSNGIDPSGNSIDKVMPRYEVNIEDVRNLIAYLKILGNENINGISDSNLRIGVILPHKNKPIGRSKSIMKTLLAYNDLINKGGGLFNRRIEIAEMYLNENGELPASIIEQNISNNSIFALVATDVAAIAESLIEIIEQNKIPVIGAISGNPIPGDYLKNDFYYLMPGIYQEIERLVNFASQSSTKTTKVRLLINNARSHTSFDSAYLNSKYQNIIQYIPEDTVVLKKELIKLKSLDIQQIIYLGSAENGRNLVATANALAWFPSVFTTGRYASSEWFSLSTSMNEKIYFSYPTWPSERDALAISQFEEMRSMYNLEQAYSYAQYNALSSLIIFTETLKLVGKNVNRNTFLDNLHTQTSIETGFVSPLKFGPNKRIGSSRVFVTKMDLVNKDLILLDK